MTCSKMVRIPTAYCSWGKDEGGLAEDMNYLYSFDTNNFYSATDDISQSGFDELCH